MAVKKPSMDPGHEETEKALKELEKKIADEYAQANKEVQAKLDDYMKRFATKDKKWREWVADGTKTKEEYKKWRTGQILVGKRWEEMRDTLAEDYHNANLIAKSITNGYLPEVYAINHNYGTYEVEHGSHLNTSYTLYDRQTVERLIKNGDVSLLPPPKEGGKTAKMLEENKDLRWNKQKVTSAITQGILQGESIDKIAKRLETVTQQDYGISVRNARTMVTGAQNAGRIDSYKRAEDMGIDMMQEWRATLDMRTRHEHRQLDGQTRKVGEPFEVDGYQIEYPGDPSAEAFLVYNCRCTLRGLVKGLEPQARKYRSEEALGGMSYEEWKESKKSESNPITLPRDKGEAIAESYRREYRNGTFGGKQDYQEEEEQKQRSQRGQLDTGYPGKVPDDELEEYNQKGYNQIKKDTGYSDEQAKKFQDSLLQYFGGDYAEIETHPESEITKNIVDGINKLPTYDGTIYRGLIFYEDEISSFTELKPGDPFPKKGVLESWTSDERTAKSFAGIDSYERSSVILECQDNTEGAGVQHLSKFGSREAACGESEL